MKEEQYCNNCGRKAHCGEVLKETQTDYEGRTYEIIVCVHCRCE